MAADSSEEASAAAGFPEEASAAEDFRVAADRSGEVQAVAGNNPHPPAWSRHIRRLWRPFLNAAEKKSIATAIAEAERHTTGQIHVEIIGNSGGRDMLELARIKFRTLGLEKTKDRNAVLILISHLDHRVAIWGDEGIHGRAGHPLWEKALNTLLGYFHERRYPEGIEACVQDIGRELALHFPKHSANAAK